MYFRLRLYGPIGKQNVCSGCTDLLGLPFCTQVTWTHMPDILALKLQALVLIWGINLQHRGLHIAFKRKVLTEKQLQLYRSKYRFEKSLWEGEFHFVT